MLDAHTINGITSEYLAAAWFTKNGFTVSWPSDHSVEYDFVIDNKTDILQRVQVKTIYFDNNKLRYIASLTLSHRTGEGKTINKKYNENSFDICAFVCSEQNVIYIVPIEHIAGRRSITFYPDNKNQFPRPFNFERYKETLINYYDE